MEMATNVPVYWEHRLALWDKEKQLQLERNRASEKPITVTLSKGKKIEAIAFKTTPMEIAKSISGELANKTIITKVNGILFDTFRPLEEDCSLEFLDFKHPEAKKVFWHSSAHILGEALEKVYSCDLTIGPALPEENGGGFYYDMSTSKVFGGQSYPVVEAAVADIVGEGQEFERLVVSKETALEMFKNNKFKLEIIADKVPDGASCTAYRCGPFIDLCKGPHLPTTARVQGFGIWKNSSAYWKGDASRDTLQRVYGMSFPNKAQYAAWNVEQEKLKERDHRNQGKKQELFFFNHLSPGSCFFLPAGAKIYNKLVEFIRSEYRTRGYTEVISPNIYNKDLWEISGHWENYRDAMFSFSVEGATYALKPMNCPGHCVMFNHIPRSYRDLPIRFAEFGVLHRNELSGTLTGLTRVRRFCQDDCHIFCRKDQIQAEIRGTLDFLRCVYGIFGFEFKLELSTRPEKYLGEIEDWEAAEAVMKHEINLFAGEGNWKINPGDGAFYGPKIDIHVFDTYRRTHQCATVQLDFQLPKRFNLKFVKEDGSAEGEDAQPVIIHRALLGSIERFMAILVEQTNGKWPLWLSPHPIMVIPVTEENNAYSLQVRDKIFASGLDVEIDFSDHMLAKKVSSALSQNCNFIVVCGKEEENKGVISVRTRESANTESLSVEDFIQLSTRLVQDRK